MCLNPSDSLMVQRHNPGQKVPLVSVCQLPFCLNPEAKAKVLSVECKMMRFANYDLALRVRPALYWWPSHHLLIIFRSQLLPSVRYKKYVEKKKNQTIMKLIKHFDLAVI